MKLITLADDFHDVDLVSGFFKYRLSSDFYLVKLREFFDQVNQYNLHTLVLKGSLILILGGRVSTVQRV